MKEFFLFNKMSTISVKIGKQRNLKLFRFYGVQCTECHCRLQDEDIYVCMFCISNPAVFCQKCVTNLATDYFLPSKHFEHATLMIPFDNKEFEFNTDFLDNLKRIFDKSHPQCQYPCNLTSLVQNR